MVKSRGCPMDRSPSADAVRERMDDIRRSLKPEVDQIVTRARELTDWRYYVRSHPWGTLATAVALGYLAVPRRVEQIRPDVETLESLAKRNKLVVEPESHVQKPPGFAESLVHLAGGMLLRAGLAYAGQQVGRFIGTHAAQSPLSEAGVSQS